jgi:hypothetical protein
MHADRYASFYARIKCTHAIITEVVLVLLVENIQRVIKVQKTLLTPQSKKSKSPTTGPDAGPDYAQELLKAILSLCEGAYAAGQLNPCILEHIVMILSLGVHSLKDRVLQLFYSIMDSPYNSLAVNFLLDILKNPQLLDIQVYSLATSPTTKDKTKDAAKPTLKTRHKLQTYSSSYLAHEYLAELSPKDQHPVDQSSAPHLLPYIISAREMLLSGAAFLLGVSPTKAKPQ